MKGIVEENSETIQEKKGEESDEVLDVAVAGGASRVERYEIAAYTAAIWLTFNPLLAEVSTYTGIWRVSR